MRVVGVCIHRNEGGRHVADFQLLTAGVLDPKRDIVSRGSRDEVAVGIGRSLELDCDILRTGGGARTGDGQVEWFRRGLGVVDQTVHVQLGHLERHIAVLLGHLAGAGNDFAVDGQVIGHRHRGGESGHHCKCEGIQLDTHWNWITYREKSVSGVGMAHECANDLACSGLNAFQMQLVAD